MTKPRRERQDIGTFLDQEARIAAFAAERHLILGLPDLATFGLTAQAAQARARTGRLHRIYRGVYSLVPATALSVQGRRLAAVLACGQGAGLSRRTAGDQRGLRQTLRAGIDVIVSEDNRTAGHPGIDLHRSRTLTPDDITLVDGIPTTTVSRTLLDLAAIIRPIELERALNQAEVLRAFDRGAIDEQLRRNRWHPGAAPLRAALDLYCVEAAPTESVAQAEFLVLVRRAGLPEPTRELHIDLGPGESIIRADCAWAQQRVIVEIDGADVHGTRAAFHRDRHRDALLLMLGWRVLRFTPRQIRSDPAGVIRIVSRVLADMASGRAAGRSA